MPCKFFFSINEVLCLKRSFRDFLSSTQSEASVIQTNSDESLEHKKWQEVNSACRFDLLLLNKSTQICSQDEATSMSRLVYQNKP